MKHFFNKCKYPLMMLAALFVLNGCIAGTRLDATRTAPTDVQGTYSLVLYGCKYANDLENLAILYKEEGPFTFKIYSPATSYQIKKGLPADEALKQADQFLRCSTDYWKTQLNKIIDREGTVAGYELRPLYVPYQYGQMDVLYVNYWLRDGTVTVYIKLDPDTEKAIENGGSTPFTGGR